MIHWQEFDWQSFSTLVTGLTAVIAALIIGWRQSQILAMQSEISEMQATTDMLRLRHELFDRRLEVYRSTMSLIRHIVSHATKPSSELQNEFLLAKGQATFLFSADVNAHLQTVWESACDYELVKGQMTRLFELEGHYGDENLVKENALMKKFVGYMHDLPKQFHELRLSEAGI